MHLTDSDKDLIATILGFYGNQFVTNGAVNTVALKFGKIVWI